MIRVYWVETKGMCLKEIETLLGETQVIVGEGKTDESVNEILEIKTLKKWVQII